MEKDEPGQYFYTYIYTMRKKIWRCSPDSGGRCWIQ